MEKERDISEGIGQKDQPVMGSGEGAMPASDGGEGHGQAAQEEPEGQGHEGDHDHDQQEHIDFGNYSKEQMLQAMEAYIKDIDKKNNDKEIKELKHHFDDVKAQERKDALGQFINNGGEEADFEYKFDGLTQRFDSLYKQYREQRAKHFQENEKNKEQNLAIKNELLERLRHLVDAEESHASIEALKAIQKEWKSAGPVPRQSVKDLWASYNALMDRFYDNRSIYFELKELDRKKNLEAKQELCEKAEKLDKQENLKDAIKELNDLHEEYKHIGPVPQDGQEALWQRFKAASDAIYAKRKDFLDNMKGELQANAEVKRKLGDETQEFLKFSSDRINDWNKKAHELLELQKRWESIGGLPRESAREINKHFWPAFKGFFNKKNAFFKSLEEQREGNLKLKEELVGKAEALKESTDWVDTSNELKKMQEQWKEIGPVPEKQREGVYKKFKNACDHFFNNRRQKNKLVEKEYQANLTQKEALIKQIEEMAASQSGDLNDLEALQNQYSEIGFVPRDAIKTVQESFNEAVNKFIEANGGGDKDKKRNMKFAVQLNNLKNSPNASTKIHKKENTLRKQISELENDISLWKNNLEFFAASKTADKLKQEFDQKIEKAEIEVRNLREQLKIVNKL